MNYKLPAVIVSVFVFISIVVAAEPVVDVHKIAGKSAEEVAKVLGKPSGKEKTKNGPKNLYRGGKIEVVFISGKADWITISEMGNVPFTANAIEALGLKQEAPSISNTNVIRWEPHSSYKSVTVFPLDGKVDYAYVKVATK